MNIGLFTDTYFPQINGVGTSTFTLARELRKLGHRVYIFTPSDPKNIPGDDTDVIRMHSMPFAFVHNFRFGIVYSPRELAKIATLHLDIVHTQTEFNLGMFGKTLSKALGIPMVHTYHTMYEDYVHYIVNGALITKNMAHSYSRIFCNFAMQVITPTEKVYNSLKEYGVIKPIHVIPTGINIDNFRQSNYKKEETLALRETFGFSKDHKIILVLGRIAKEKSIDVVVSAMPEVFEKNSMARLLIVGDGPHRAELEKQVKELGIGEKVVFAGAKPWGEIGRYYQLGDVFVSASVSETQGLTFVEAMAAGVPVIAKKDECLKGVVEDGVTGIIFSENQQLSQKILNAIENDELRETLVKNGIEFSENLSAETFGKNVEAVYKTVLEQSVASPKKIEVLQHQMKSISRLAEYELIKIKRANKKIRKIALSPAKAVKNTIKTKWR
ncbi:MAG: glycosyltransferase family 4 protein [Anaerotignaceae bacterium]